MGKSSRRLGIALAGAALALSLIVPAASAYGGVDLGNLNMSKDCGQAGAAFGSDAQGQCSYNIAQPTGGDQESTAVSVAKNSFEPVQIEKQGQLNVQNQSSDYRGELKLEDFGAKASQEVKSGSVNVDGNKVELNLFGAQIANAGAKGGNGNNAMTTGDAENEIDGNNGALINAGAANNTDGSISGDAKIIKAGVDANGGDAGNAPEVEKFGVDAGKGGSNVNVGLGSSEAEGANGGFGMAGSLAAAISAAVPVDNGNKSGANADDAKADSGANASDGGSNTAGTGNQSDPKQTAGAGGGAWFQVSGNGGNGGAGGWGQLNNTNNVSGTTNAWGQANGGTIGNTSLGNYGEAISGANGQEYYVVGGTAVNSNTVGVSVTGNQNGTSGNVSSSSAPSVQMPLNINMSNNPAFASQCNDPVQSSSNTATAGNMSASGSPSSSNSQTVSAAEQKAGNIGVQDALKAYGSFNKKTVDVTKTFTDNSNHSVNDSLNNNDVDVSVDD